MIARQIFNPDGSNLRRWDYVIDPGHNRIQTYTWRYREGPVRTLGIGHDKSQSRIAEAPTDTLPTPTIFQQRAYYYDALERVTGTLHYEVSRSTVEIYNPWWHREILGPNLFGETAHNAFDSVNVSITTPIDRPNACRYDPAGRMWDPCDDNGPSSLAFDGDNVVRTGGDLALARYTFLHGPGVDDPLLGHRTGGGVGETVIYITNGMGEVFSTARASGHASLSQSSSHNPTYAGASNNLDSYENNRTGAFNASLVYYRNRFYDPETARWTQEDPIGIAGGLNLFSYGSNNPSTFMDRNGMASSSSQIPQLDPLIAIGIRMGLIGDLAEALESRLRVPVGSKERRWTQCALASGSLGITIAGDAAVLLALYAASPAVLTGLSAVGAGTAASGTGTVFVASNAVTRAARTAKVLNVKAAAQGSVAARTAVGGGVVGAVPGEVDFLANEAAGGTGGDFAMGLLPFVRLKPAFSQFRARCFQ